jgi:hypothetical protein
MQPDFATPFIRGVAQGVVVMLPALLVVAGIMVGFWLVTRRRRGQRRTRR